MLGKSIERLVNARQQIRVRLRLLGTVGVRRHFGFGCCGLERQVESRYATTYSADENEDSDCQTSE